MKRIKSLLAGLCAFTLVAAFAVGTWGYVPVASAATTGASQTLDFGTNKAPASTVKYGEAFSVPVISGWTVKVTDPTGAEITDYVAKTLGVYTVTYTKDGGDGYKYTFKVLSQLENELELRVAEADIPTVVAKGGTATLPEAKVGYYDEDGKWVDYPAASYTVKITARTVAAPVVVSGERNYNFSQKGTTFIEYVATLNGGTKRLTKTYEVKVQETLSDESAPSISVSGVPTSASVNTAVTLPVATATHSTDERVKVTVVVVDPSGNKVKDVNVDDNGFAAPYDGAPEVAFDNDKTVKFYPTEVGTYKVTYKATADNGKSTKDWTYNIVVSDKKAPIVEIDSAVIPAKWAYDSVKNAADDEKGTSVTFPFPTTLADNVSAKENIKVKFVLKDPAGNEAARVENANSSDKNGNTVSSYAGANDIKFTESGFAFDFGAYKNFRQGVKADYQYEGTYTATYTVLDEKNNSVTKSFSVDVVETFEDEENVNVSYDDVSEQIVYASESEAVEYVIPAATVSCANDSALSVKYTVSDKVVKAGETYEIKKESDDKYYLIISDTDKVEITAGSFEIKAVATSDTGNSGDAIVNVKVVVPAAAQQFTVDHTAGDAEVNGTKVTLSTSIKIECTADLNDAGIELGVKDSEGKYYVVEADIFSIGKNLFVRNISFDGMVKSGKYYLEAKVFDRHDHAKVFVDGWDLTAPAPETPLAPSAALKATTSTVNVSVKLAKENTAVYQSEISSLIDSYFTSGTDHLVYVHKVSGGRFSLIGDDFTALSTGNYRVTDVPELIIDSTKDVYRPTDASKAEALDKLFKNKENHTDLAVSDDSTVKFDLADELVSYAAINADVDLPKGIAYTDAVNAEVTVKVTDPNGSNVTVTADKFRATKNGSYTVTYTASIEGKEDKTFSYTVKVGDLVAPEFTVTDGKDYTLKPGATFKFAKVECTEEGNASYTYSKTITRDGTTVASVTGASTETSSEAIVLSESGKYVVTYTVTDENGNKSTQTFNVTVSDSASSSGISLAALSAILIVVGVLLIAGVIVYLFRFRTVKKDR